MNSAWIYDPLPSSCGIDLGLGSSHFKVFSLYLIHRSEKTLIFLN
jgi:hypothetical protein